MKARNNKKISKLKIIKILIMNTAGGFGTGWIIFFVFLFIIILIVFGVIIFEANSLSSANNCSSTNANQSTTCSTINIISWVAIGFLIFFILIIIIAIAF